MRREAKHPWGPDTSYRLSLYQWRSTFNLLTALSAIKSFYRKLIYKIAFTRLGSKIRCAKQVLPTSTVISNDGDFMYSEITKYDR